MEMRCVLRPALSMLTVFGLHFLVNYVNRVTAELICGCDCNMNTIQPSFLVMLALLYLLTMRPCHFSRYCTILVTGEVLLQLLYILAQCGLFSFAFYIVESIPCLWKVALLLGALWWYLLTKRHSGDDDCLKQWTCCCISFADCCSSNLFSSMSSIGDYSKSGGSSANSGASLKKSNAPRSPLSPRCETAENKPPKSSGDGGDSSVRQEK